TYSLSRATVKQMLRATPHPTPPHPPRRTPPPSPRARSRVQNKCKCDFRKSQGQKRKEAVFVTPETAVRKPWFRHRSEPWPNKDGPKRDRAKARRLDLWCLCCFVCSPKSNPSR